MTYQIIYSSESATPMQIEDLEDILQHARGSNDAKGITGALIYVEGVFLQILEGDKKLLDDLMRKIAKDVRHETVTILRASETSVPKFSDWKMAYVSATAEQISKWLGLDKPASAQEILIDLRQDPQHVTMVAQSILALLAPKAGHSSSPN